MPRAAEYNIDIYYGKKFEETWTWLDAFGNPVDVSAYEAEHVITKEPDNKNPVILARVTKGSGITLGSDGTILVSHGGASLKIEGIEKAYHALVVYSSGNIDDDGERIIQGIARIHESRT